MTSGGLSQTILASAFSLYSGPQLRIGLYLWGVMLALLVFEL
jgi:hypothetical protein